MIRQEKSGGQGEKFSAAPGRPNMVGHRAPKPTMWGKGEGKLSIADCKFLIEDCSPPSPGVSNAEGGTRNGQQRRDPIPPVPKTRPYGFSNRGPLLESGFAADGGRRGLFCLPVAGGTCYSRRWCERVAGSGTACRRFFDIGVIGSSFSAWKGPSRRTFTWKRRNGMRSFGWTGRCWLETGVFEAGNWRPFAAWFGRTKH